MKVTSIRNKKTQSIFLRISDITFVFIFFIFLLAQIPQYSSAQLVPFAFWKASVASSGWISLPSQPPVARAYHKAVWSGSRMLAWGGYDGSGYFNDGRQYDPVADSWSAMTTTSAPSARRHHTAVWTGTEMIVYGGTSGSIGLSSGGKYNPVTDTWTSMSSYSGRYNHTAGLEWN